MSFILQIAAFVAVCALLFIFGQGLAVLIGGEFQWSREKVRLSGAKARTIGLFMILCGPLGISSVIATGAFLDHDFQEVANTGMIAVAASAWTLLKLIGRQTNSCPNCSKTLRKEKAKQCFKCGAEWRSALILRHVKNS